MKLLILDFDGVLCNSSYECYIVAWKAWQRLTNNLESRHTEKPPEKAWSIFKKLRPQARIAADYLEIIEKITSVSKKIAVPSDKERFVKFFYEERKKMRNNSLDEWLKINPPFNQPLEIFNSWVSKIPIYIASVKDFESVKSLLKYYNLKIPQENIYAKHNLNKCKTINHILTDSSIDPKNVVFIDDNPQNLQFCVPLGIHLILASWGYVPKNGRKIAQQIKADIATLENFQKILQHRL